MDTAKKAKLNANSYISVLATENRYVFEKGTLQIKQLRQRVSLSPYQACPPQGCTQGSTQRSGKWQAYPLAANTFDNTLHKTGKLQIQAKFIIQTLFLTCENKLSLWGRI